MPVFGKEPEDKMHRVISEMINRVNDNTKRLRDLERAYDSTTSRAIAIEQDIISMKKKLMKDIEDINKKMDEKKTQIMRISETVKEIMKQMKFFATKTKVEELESMLNIFNPLESVFTTKDEVKKIVREEMRQ
jgi:16S rRNA G527 N7-methylase RsmG